tara:strand:+ start:1683 stop:2882 length:1200 start_codon:yes stop_codon:yes gene_type:complete
MNNILAYVLIISFLIIIGLGIICFLLNKSLIFERKVGINAMDKLIEEKKKRVAYLKKNKKELEVIIESKKTDFKIIEELFLASSSIRESFEMTMKTNSLFFGEIAASDMSNIKKLAFIVGIINQILAINQFKLKLLSITKENPKEGFPTTLSANILKEIKSIKIQTEKGMELNEKYIEKTLKKNISISDSELNTIKKEFATLLMMGADLNDENKEKIKKMISDLGSNDHSSDKINEYDTNIKNREVVTEITKDNIKNFSKNMSEIEMIKKISDSVNLEDVEEHSIYMENLKEMLDEHTNKGTTENDFELKFLNVCTAIPEINSISKYIIWYKYFQEISETDKIKQATAEEKDIIIKVMYISMVKIESYCEQYKKKIEGTKDFILVNEVSDIINTFCFKK